MAIGRQISLTPNIATKTLSVSATAAQTSFTVTGGYRINELGVYRNGVRLVQGKDFTASDGLTVTLLSAASLDDDINFVIFDSFNIADAINSVGNQTIDGELTVTKILGDGSELTGIAATDNLNTNNIKVSGITTLGTTSTVVGSAVTFTASGGTIVGVLTATSFSGDGSALTGIAATDNLNTNNIQVSGITTLGTVTTVVGSAVTFNASGGTVVGVLTATSFEGSGANLTGVAATDYIVSNSLKVLGISTFAGGDIQIDGSAAGVSSVTWDASADSLIFKDTSYAKFGDSSDLSIYHDGTTNIIDTASANLEIRHGAEKLAAFAQDGQAELYFNNTKKFETTNTGTIITGICTATSFENADGSSLGISAAKAVGLSAFLG